MTLRTYVTSVGKDAASGPPHALPASPFLLLFQTLIQCRKTLMWPYSLPTEPLKVEYFILLGDTPAHDYTRNILHRTEQASETSSRGVFL